MYLSRYITFYFNDDKLRMAVVPLAKSRHAYKAPFIHVCPLPIFLDERYQKWLKIAKNWKVFNNPKIFQKKWATKFFEGFQKHFWAQRTFPFLFYLRIRPDVCPDICITYVFCSNFNPIRSLKAFLPPEATTDQFTFCIVGISIYFSVK